MAQVRIRKDVWKLPEWDPILLWYAKAIADMQKRPINDPVSWRYQAAIHKYVIGHDPLEDPADQLPAPAEQKRFWSQCQHGSWFFLPWHRMYLGCFEQIIMKTVRALGGPDDWALPYWNYSDITNPDAKKLPIAFRASHLPPPDGSANPLRVNQRAPAANNGYDVGDDFDVDVKSCLKEPVFMSQPAGGAPSFGGPRTGFHHPAGPAGSLEAVPHGSMHDAVGGGQWMSAFNTAALDPIFWLHHCNIDRLWEVWLRRDPHHRNPAESPWLTGLAFELHDATGAIVSMTASQVLDTTTQPLLYEYEDVTDPLGGPTPITEIVVLKAIEESFMPEMVGATAKPVILRGERATTAFPVFEPSGPASFAFSSGELARRVYLNIENIVGEGYAGSYSVYLNIPEDAQPSDYEERYAGLLPMFGVSEASDPDRDHPDHGLQYTLDITDVVQHLQSTDDWKPNGLRVTFFPKVRGEESDDVQTRAPVRIGRVSLYYS